MMKKTVTVSIEEVKLSALKLYLEKKGQTLEDELEKCVETLYLKSVPAGVRDYISLSMGNTEKKKKVISSGVGDEP